MSEVIPIFIGYDSRERAATNVLIDSLYQKSSLPLSITPLVLSQLKNSQRYWRTRKSNESTDFSFTRFLVPNLMGYRGWAIFMDCDMLCRGDIADLWSQRNENMSVMCVKHNHKPKEERKFLGEIQSKYEKKNWSSLIMFNCKFCKKLTLEYVNSASGLELHQFKWLNDDNQIGSIQERDWNYLVDVESENSKLVKDGGPKLIHWTLGGPWFKDINFSDSYFAIEWFKSREDSMGL